MNSFFCVKFCIRASVTFFRKSYKIFQFLPTLGLFCKHNTQAFNRTKKHHHFSRITVHANHIYNMIITADKYYLCIFVHNSFLETT